jgi:hypothetical protein
VPRDGRLSCRGAYRATLPRLKKEKASTMTKRLTIATCVITALIAGAASTFASYVTVYRDHQTPDESQPQSNQFIALQSAEDMTRGSPGFRSVSVSGLAGFYASNPRVTTVAARASTGLREAKRIMKAHVKEAARRPGPNADSGEVVVRTSVLQ